MGLFGKNCELHANIRVNVLQTSSKEQKLYYFLLGVCKKLKWRGHSIARISSQYTNICPLLLNTSITQTFRFLVYHQGNRTLIL
jgi:hypothetical protein